LVIKHHLPWQINVFKLGKMVIPVNVTGNHWCLCVAHVAQGHIQ
jgi:Ulp1 family protease